MLLIGKYRLIHSESFILPANDSATLRIKVGQEEINCRISFVKDHSKRESFGISSDIDPEDPDMALITLRNWDRPTRIFTPEPFNFVDLDSGQQVFTMISATYQNDHYLVFLQYLVESEQ